MIAQLEKMINSLKLLGLVFICTVHTLEFYLSIINVFMHGSNYSFYMVHCTSMMPNYYILYRVTINNQLINMKSINHKKLAKGGKGTWKMWRSLCRAPEN